MSQQIRVTWNIHWSCNYRCSYCFFDKEWTDKARRNAYLSPEQWLAHWRRLYLRYGRAFVVINGGEPLVYPGFLELLRRLSGLHWPINVTTNASTSLDEYAATVDHSRVSLSVSYHPQFATLSEFVEKVKALRSGGVDIGCINFVAYPPFIGELPATVARLQAIGESLKVIPYVGVWKGVKFPEGYDAGQKRAIGLHDEWVDSKRPQGRVCPAGQRSALLLPDGQVTRCGQVGDPGIFGSFFDEAFELHDRPMPCDAEFCPCDEWKTIPDEKAPALPGAWLP